jgi:hypothetical protein
MTNNLLDLLAGEIGWVHWAILDLCQDAEHFSVRPGPQAPPVGWHLWHISAFADRLQASLPPIPAAERRPFHADRLIWAREGLAAAWGLDPASLGWEATGMLMDHAAAAALPVERQAAISGYARAVFEAVDDALAGIRPRDLLVERTTIHTYAGDGEVNASDLSKTCPLALDLIEHLEHAARHMGMIEGLLGVIGDQGGSATV